MGVGIGEAIVRPLASGAVVIECQKVARVGVGVTGAGAVAIGKVRPPVEGILDEEGIGLEDDSDEDAEEYED